MHADIYLEKKDSTEHNHTSQQFINLNLKNQHNSRIIYNSWLKIKLVGVQSHPRKDSADTTLFDVSRMIHVYDLHETIILLINCQLAHTEHIM